MEIKINRDNEDWKLGTVIIGNSAQPFGMIVKNSVGDYCAISLNDAIGNNNFSTQEKCVLSSKSYDSIACLQDELEPQGYYAAHATLNIDVDHNYFH